MLPAKLLILLFLGKGYYVSFMYANLINSVTNTIKVKLNKRFEVTNEVNPCHYPE